MSVRVSLQQVQKHLPELLDRLASTEEEVVVQRDGKDFAVIVSARQWRRRDVGRRLDALGDDMRISKAHQARLEWLLREKIQRSLTAAERREVKSLLQECDSVMLRRVAALDKVLLKSSHGH